MDEDGNIIRAPPTTWQWALPGDNEAVHRWQVEVSEDTWECLPAGVQPALDREIWKHVMSYLDEWHLQGLIEFKQKEMDEKLFLVAVASLLMFISGYHS